MEHEPQKKTGDIQKPNTNSQNEDMFQLLVENLIDYSIILLDVDGHVMTWNTAAQRLKGWTAEEIIGKHFSIFYSQDDIDRNKPKMELDAALKDGRFEDEGWRLRKDGSRFWANVVFTALRDKDGNLRGFGKVTRNLTERKQYEQSRNRLAAIIDSTTDLVGSCTSEGWLTFLNEAGRKMVGINQNEDISKVKIAEVHPAWAAQVVSKEALPAALKNGSWTGETAILTKSGKEIPISQVIIAHKNSKGELEFFSTIGRDISERKRTEEKIKRQAQEIFEMATVPVVQVWEGVVLVPLIGTLDSTRTQQLMERLLQRVAETASPVALLDITGVPTIDTQTAQHLIETINAVRLIGAEVIMTGIRPIIAQTLVHLGIDLSNVITRSSLAAGLRMALEIMGLKVGLKKDGT